MSQEQPRIRASAQRLGPGDVYPASGNPAARAQRDDALAARHDAGDRGLVVLETGLPGQRLFTAVSGDQTVAQFSVTEPSEEIKGTGDAVTIGEALEAAGMTAGDKPVDRADAAAVQAAEARATGRGGPAPGGLGSVAQSAADANARVTDKEQRAKLGDVLAGAAARLPADKAATREDAERVRKAEERNYREAGDEEEGGVAAAVAAASSINAAKTK
ncbi:late embryogenesis abundant protein D-34-like [Canna indica]|uniref:Late embryogenesis abundant protein D-34-like n=1 Tax=Canna indica TaxID=4628 RepID=A0AAQ3Q846_9LILI|nr:late embryogenesis abundant protein D-34-like [Canna indica]